MWAKVGGRDKLAELTGISPTMLSGYNTGNERLGRGNAERIIAAIPGETLDNLGIPPAEAPLSLERIMDEIRTVREILDSRSSWLAEVEAQLQNQTRLLGSMTAMAETLTGALASLEVVAADLRAAADAFPRSRPKKRPA